MFSRWKANTVRFSHHFNIQYSLVYDLHNFFHLRRGGHAPMSPPSGYATGYAVWVVDSGGPKEPCRPRWGPHNLWERAVFGEKGRHIVKKLCKNGWTDRDAVWVMESGGPNETCIKWGIFMRKDMPDMSGDTLSWAAQNGWTDRHAVWVVNSGGSKEACVTWGHVGVTWRLRLNLVRRCGLMANYFDHWFFLLIQYINLQGFRTVLLFPNHGYCCVVYACVVRK